MLTRDSYLWNILLTLGLALGTATSMITNATEWGLTPIQLNWIRLIATVLAGVGGKFGSSKLPHSDET